MKTLKKISMLLLLSISMFCISCSKDSENDTGTKTFNKNDYTEYFICKADGVQYAVGNNSIITISIFSFMISGTLYINTSDHSISAASQEVKLQLKSFNKTIAKNYDVSGTYPCEINKLNGTDDYYITNDGTLSVQANAIKVTKIDDGYMYGTFAFTAYDEIDKTKSIKVTDGEFKVKIPD
jgi:hypothetical protein